MKPLLACLALYIAALSVFVWLIMPAKKPPAFIPVDIRFCHDWRDHQHSLCERIPFRKEWAI
jgi:hypothetical protein